MQAEPTRNSCRLMFLVFTDGTRMFRDILLYMFLLSLRALQDLKADL
jgi:hypothetical protein